MKKRDMQKLNKTIIFKFDRITVSDEVKQHFLNIYGECDKNTKVFHNLLDTDRILKLSKQAMDKADRHCLTGQKTA